MNIKFVGAPNTDIKDDVQGLIKQCKKASISVAYLKKSGVELIRKSVEENKVENSKISIFTSLNFGITDENGLRELLNMDVRCRIVNNNNFHPKLYIFEMLDGNATMIIGSSNLSNGGLSTNYEANLILNGNVSESPIKDAIEYISLIESKSIPLDEEIINLYGKSKSTVDEIDNKLDNNIAANELKEYISRKILSEKLTESKIDEFLIKAENHHNEASYLYDKGMIHESLSLYQEEYDIYNKLANVDDFNDLLEQKMSCLINMEMAYRNSNQLDAARKCADELEKVGEILYNSNNDSILLFYGLGHSIISQREFNKNYNKKCNRFIELYELNKNNSKFKDKDNYNLVGLVYLSSAECKFELNSKEIAVKHLYSAINYLEKHLKNELKNSETSFALMMAYVNMANALKEKRIITHKNSLDGTKINKLYHDALDITQKIDSKFWEGFIRQKIGIYTNSYNETFRELRLARTIFDELGYDEVVKEINELIDLYKQH